MLVPTPSSTHLPLCPRIYVTPALRLRSGTGKNELTLCLSRRDQQAGEEPRAAPHPPADPSCSNTLKKCGYVSGP